MSNIPGNMGDTDRIKVLTLGDHPMLPSGVGTQTKYVIEAILNTKKFRVLSLGGAIKHPDYRPAKTHEYGDEWVIAPVDGYGTAEIVRTALMSFKPDIVWFMTDPRFYEWLWAIEDEIREVAPLVYYHVWDNYPYPNYNKSYYDSNDCIVTISKVTSDIVRTVAPDVKEKYIPHAVNSEIFKKYTTTEKIHQMRNLRKSNGLEDRFVCFWNNRNARRKQSGSLLFWWKAFLDEVGHDKASLIMHTDVVDPNGQPLKYLADYLGLTGDKQVIFSENKVSPEELALFYNVADCTINISDAEGFGLSTLESLACGTPIIVTMTGGLKEQVTDGKNWFGIGIKPTSQAVIGSLNVPWIYEDRINQEVFVDAVKKMYEMTPKKREKMGVQGTEHVNKNYNFEDFNKAWQETMLEIHETFGSWDNRSNYDRWELVEL